MGVLNFLIWQTVGLLNYFKMADLSITEDLHRPGTLHEEENRRGEKRTTVGEA